MPFGTVTLHELPVCSAAPIGEHVIAVGRTRAVSMILIIHLNEDQKTAAESDKVLLT
jgi:hypothetical protein